MKFWSKLREIFNRWSYHDDNSHVVNYTMGKNGVFGRHIDWDSLGKHLLFWSLLVVFLMILSIMVLRFIAIAIWVILIGLLLYKVPRPSNNVNKNNKSHNETSK